MARNKNDLFNTVRIEGALLSPDLLKRIVSAPEEVEGLKSSDYNLVGNERLNEAINRSWNRLTALWKGFQEVRERLTENDWGTGLTRDRWLLPLFQELGYGRLMVAKAQELEGKNYPISHAWENIPIHLLGCRLSLDHRTSGAAGAATMKPHSLVQEYLNRSDAQLWGIVSNGLTLRLLRDNASIALQAYIEFDLEAIMEGELYSDFVLVWLLCHQSRFEAENPADCWLECWCQSVQQEGSRVLDQLRSGVIQAISVLGQGFLEHPANGALCDVLRNGQLDKQDYYRQLLRLVYRLIFLCTAEDRNLLFPQDTSEKARGKYDRYYSLRRLRLLAERRRGTQHHDLFQQLKLVMTYLGIPAGCPTLGLPALGSFLWSDQTLPDLMASEISNRSLLEALRALTLHQDGTKLTRVDFRHLGAEELGSVYESLLELHPELHIEARKFQLNEAAGNERKTSGSYYTPTSLINCLLDSALDPVLEEAARQANPEEAILNLKVCDPACGSGQFLVGAARRIAYRLAAERSVEADPSAYQYRQALRQVVGRCIYGVDINEMAVELCKINLWLESLEPGMPLCFLDHHIKCGNSLLGTTSALFAKGIPDEAFKAIEGDNKKDVSALKRQNQHEREGQWGLFDSYSTSELGVMSEYMKSIDEILEKDLKEQSEKEKRYYDLVESVEYSHQVLCADAWCAAFVCVKDCKKNHSVLTQDVINRLKRDPDKVDPETIEEIGRISKKYQFFHWHLAFSDVFQTPIERQVPENAVMGWSGGFDVVLGNPPWEKMQTEEIQFFADKDPYIAGLKGVRRKNAIAVLSEQYPDLARDWEQQKRKDAASVAYIRNSGAYPLTGVGKFNTYALFSELNTKIISQNGMAGFVIPSSIATDDTTKNYFQYIIHRKILKSLYDFENTKPIFAGVHRSYRFCLLTVSNGINAKICETDFVFFAHDIDELKDRTRHFSQSADDIALINPNTLTCPVFPSIRDAIIAKSVYVKIPIFLREKAPEENSYNPKVWRLINTSDDSSKFIDFEAGSTVGIVEAKTIHQFDHRYSTYVLSGKDHQLIEVSDEEKMDLNFTAKARYFISDSYFRERMPEEFAQKKWFLTFRNITHAGNQRTVISTIIPRNASCEVTPYVEISCNPRTTAFLTGVFNSYILDYIARQKMTGMHLSYYILYQLPVITPQQIKKPFSEEFFYKRVLELTYTAWDLASFANDCGYEAPPFRWDAERRFLIRCELDAAYFHLYGIEREDVDYIMETFPIVKRKDEVAFGSYRTKDTILEIYDQMKSAIDSGLAYQTPLNPPPGPPEVWPIPAGEHWPKHIHQG